MNLKFSSGCLGVLIWVSANVVSAQNPIVLNEIMFDAAGSEAHDEYVEVLHIGRTGTVDLKGWRIGDGEETDAIVDVRGGTLLKPGQFGLILDSSYFGNSTTYDPIPKEVLLLTIEDRAFGKGGWSNTSAEPVVLIDATGDTVARFRYSIGNKPGRSEEKIDPEAGDEIDNWGDALTDGGTPGDENSLRAGATLVAPRSMVINEVMYAPREEGSEWVELFNRTEEKIDLRFWSIQDARPFSASRIAIRPLLIPPGGFVVIASDPATFAEVFPGISVVAPVERWPSLNNSGDAVVIKSPAGTSVDSVSYTGKEIPIRGISLERIDPGGESGDPSNWLPSVLEAGGSPGARNSVFAGRLPEEVELTASPNPFRDWTTISYRIPTKSAEVNLWVHDSRGHLVRRLLDGQISGSRRTVLWDGQDDNGERLYGGIYIVYLEAINVEEGRVFTEKKAVVWVGGL